MNPRFCAPETHALSSRLQALFDLGHPGLEPGTCRLKAEYSTIELATLTYKFYKALPVYNSIDERKGFMQVFYLRLQEKELSKPSLEFIHSYYDMLQQRKVINDLNNGRSNI